jgi:hypothetical protein
VSIPRPLATRPAEARRELERLSEGHYMLSCIGVDVAFEIARIRRDRLGELRGDLDVHCGLAGAQSFDGILDSYAGFALSNARTRQETGRRLQAKARIQPRELDFSSLLDELHLRVRRAMLDGDGAVYLADVPRPAVDDAFAVDGLPLLKRLPTVWAAAGGTGKSTLMLYVAGKLQQQGIAVAVVDWEMEAEDHRPRLEALFGGDMPRVTYIRATQPLAYELERITRIGRERYIDYYCIDSVGFAAGGSLKDEESALAYFRALRVLNRGSLTLAHVAKPKEGVQDPQSPFGSAFWENGARSVWYLRPAEASGDGNVLTVGFFHRKNNTGRKKNPLGFELSFHEDRIAIKRVNLAAVEGLSAQLPLRMRIQHVLRHGFKTVEEIADELDAKPDTVKRTINRFSKGALILFAKVSSAEGKKELIGNAAETRKAS